MSKLVYDGVCTNTINMILQMVHTWQLNALILHPETKVIPLSRMPSDITSSVKVIFNPEVLDASTGKYLLTLYISNTSIIYNNILLTQYSIFFFTCNNNFQE